MTAKEIFADNLRYYMDLHHKSRKEVCQALNVNYHTFSDWYNAKKFPKMNSVERLADYFGVEVSDFINRHEDNHDTEDMPDVITAAIKNARIKRGMTVEQLAELLDTTPKEVRRYEAGKAFPFNHLLKLDEILDIKYFEILGLENFYNVNYLKIYNLSLNNAQLEELFLFAKFLKYKDDL